MENVTVTYYDKLATFIDEMSVIDPLQLSLSSKFLSKKGKLKGHYLGPYKFLQIQN